MSDNQDKDFLASVEHSAPSKLHICLFPSQQSLTSSLIKLLDGDRYKIEDLNLADDFVDFITNNREKIDCIVFINDPNLSFLLGQLWKLEIVLPIVIIEIEQTISIASDHDQDLGNSSTAISSLPNLYHSAEVRLYLTQLEEINSYINLAITKFLNLAPSCSLAQEHLESKQKHNGYRRNPLVIKQRKLAEKLKERLGYLGVYYKRNAQDFYRNLSQENKKKFLQQLSIDYRKILLNYFIESSEINKLIDEFVDRAFFADISTSQVLEIHMELIDQFSQQLQIEGRSEDILLDYRLALIDIIAHLCEMYRRSIPGEDISLELLFRVE